jgi:hypothetical protein
MLSDFLESLAQAAQASVRRVISADCVLPMKEVGCRRDEGAELAPNMSRYLIDRLENHPRIAIPLKPTCRTRRGSGAEQRPRRRAKGG